MNTYHYIQHSKEGGKDLVFTTDALNILEADKLAKAAGFDPMRLACSPGLKLVLFYGCTSSRLSKEQVIKITNLPIKNFGEPTEKYIRVFPKFHYVHDKTIHPGNSKKQIVAAHKEILGRKIYESVQMQWLTPDGVTTIATDIKKILQELDAEARIVKKADHDK